jgi:hypothetical protein
VLHTVHDTLTLREQHRALILGELSTKNAHP